MSDFDRAYAFTMGSEGEYQNDPIDPGGETWCGISRRANPDWPGWSIVDRIKATENIESIHGVEVSSVAGEGRLDKVTIRTCDTGEEKTIDASAMFIFIGVAPRSEDERNRRASIGFVGAWRPGLGSDGVSVLIADFMGKGIKADSSPRSE